MSASPPRTGSRAALGAHVRARVVSAAWTALANALPRAALLLAGIYVARRFGPDAFAHYSLALVTVTVAGGIVSLSLVAVGTKFVPELARHETPGRSTGVAALLGFGVALAGTLGVATFALTAPLATMLGAPGTLDGALRIAAGVVTASVIYGAVHGVVVGSGRFAVGALATIAGTLAGAALLVPLADRAGFAGVLAALGVLYAATSVAEFAWIAPEAIGDLRRSTRGELAGVWRRATAFLTPMVVFVSVLSALVWLCNAMLAREGSLPAIARFNVAYNWYAVAGFIPNVLAQVEFVRLSRAKARGDAAAVKSILRLAVLQNALVMLPLVGLGMIFADVLAGMFRVDDAEGRLAVRCMLAAALLASLSNPTGVFFSVVDRIWTAAWLLLCTGAVILLLAWILRDYGAPGVSFAFIAGFALHLMMTLAVARRVPASPGR